MSINVDKLKELVELHADGHIENCECNGVSARVYEHGKLIFETVRGYTDASHTKPLRIDSIFRMASMTKPIVATATLIAEQEGLLSVFDSVSKYIPEYRDLYVAARDENGGIVKGDRVDLKIYQCLCHTSGIMCGFPYTKDGKTYPAPQELQPAITEDERRTVTEAVLNSPKWLVGFVPGTCATYCSYAGNDICCEILNRVTGMPFEQYIQKRILDPLGMKDTTFTPNEEQYSRLIALHERIDGKNHDTDMGKRIFASFYPTYHSGGAAIVSTIEDYSRFMLMLMDWGKWEDKTIIEVPEIYRMKTAYAPQALEKWGLGVRTTKNDAVLPDGCYGWSGAYGTHYWVDYANDVCCIYMRNSSWDGGSQSKISLEFEKDVMASFEGNYNK